MLSIVLIRFYEFESFSHFLMLKSLLRSDTHGNASGGVVFDLVREQLPLHCEAGVVRLFGAADIGVTGLVSGWAEPEEGHTWNDGVEAALLLTTRRRPGAALLLLTGEPYVSRARPVQELTVFGNGFRLASWRMAHRTETMHTIRLEPEWWLDRVNHSVMHLAFCLPLSARPKDLADGPDGRELGFCFRSICLREIAG